MLRSVARLFLPSPGANGKYAAYVLGQSAVAVSGAADTNENTLATITVPASAIGPNGTLRIWTQWSHTSSANNKVLRVRFSGAAGSSYLAATNTASTYAVYCTLISNRNATNSQVGTAPGNNAISNAGTATGVTSAVDTTAETTVVITGAKALGSETLTLERYLVEVLYGA